MQKQSTYVRDLYAISEAIAKFRHYLLGHKFIIRTDQKSLKSLTEQAIQTPKEQVWLHKFLGYDFPIEYKPDKENIPADALSRSFLMALSTPQNNFLHQIHEAIVADPHLQEIRQQCIQGAPPDPHFQVLSHLLYWKSRLVIPPHPEVIKLILTEYHSFPIGGHAGIARTKARIARYKDIHSFVSHCLICQQAKTATTLPAGLLQPLLIPTQIWEDLAMDFIMGLPSSNGFTMILVVIDRLSKYANFAPLRSDYSSLKVAKNFMHTVVKLNGIPKSIVSDRDKVFTSTFW